MRERPTIKSDYTKQDLVDYANERADAELASLVKIQKILQKGKKEVTEIEEYNEPLAITAGHTITIELSTGGDADGFVLSYDSSNLLSGGVYYWADWGVYEEVRLSRTQAELVEYVYLAGDGGCYLS